jgi:myo-inositol-1-phosphate synthase
VQPADGRLGVLTVGLGAVSSTLIAGVELVKRGLAQPIGSLALLDTIRLGKRTDDRSPLIRDFVPLASLDDLVFGAWDPFPDDAYVAAQRAGVLEAGRHIEQISDALRDVRPMAPRSTAPTSRTSTPTTCSRRSTSARCSTPSGRTSTGSVRTSRSTGS